MGQNNWNSKSVAPKVEGNLATEFHGGWINYKKADGNWSPIDTTLIKDGTGFHMDKAPFSVDFPLLSDGEATFTSNNRWDIFNKTDITADPFSQSMEAFGVGSVAGEFYDINGDGRLDAVKYPDAYGVGIHLVYYVLHGKIPKLKQLVQFDQKPLIDTDYEFENTYSGKVEISPRRLPDNTTRRQHRDNSNAILNTPQILPHDEGFYIRKDSEPQKRGIGIKTPLIWDSGGKQEVIEADIRKGVGVNKYILTKHIKTSFFDGVTYPVFTDTTSTFYPDANVESTSVDGFVMKSGSSDWDTVHNATTSDTANDDSDRLQINSSIEGAGVFNIERAFALFDTSAIGSDTVDSATLDCYFFSKNNGDNDGDDFVNVVQSSPASNTALVVADYDQCGATHSPVEGATRIDITGVTINTYTSFTLNATGLGWIDGSGITKLGIREGHDIVDSPIVGADFTRNWLYCRSADHATAAERIKLVVEHTPPAGRQRFIGSRPDLFIDKQTIGDHKNPIIR